MTPFADLTVLERLDHPVLARHLRDPAVGLYGHREMRGREWGMRNCGTAKRAGRAASENVVGSVMRHSEPQKSVSIERTQRFVPPSANAVTRSRLTLPYSAG